MVEPGIIVVDGEHSHADRVGRMARSMRLDSELYDTAEEMLEAGLWQYGGVLVSEFRLLGINGIDLQQKLTDMGSTLEVVFHTGHAETWLTVLAMRQGAFTVLEKPASDQSLWDALRLAMDRYRERIARQAERNKLRRIHAQMSARHREVFRQMNLGVSNKQIASQLDVSVRTVESCRHAIFEKTGTRNIAQLVRLVVQCGIDLGELSPTEVAGNLLPAHQRWQEHPGAGPK